MAIIINGSTISAVSFGSQSIDAAYVGPTQVFGAQAPSTSEAWVITGHSITDAWTGKTGSGNNGTEDLAISDGIAYTQYLVSGPYAAAKFRHDNSATLGDVDLVNTLRTVSGLKYLVGIEAMDQNTGLDSYVTDFGGGNPLAYNGALLWHTDATTADVDVHYYVRWAGDNTSHGGYNQSWRDRITQVSWAQWDGIKAHVDANKAPGSPPFEFIYLDAAFAVLFDRIQDGTYTQFGINDFFTDTVHPNTDLGLWLAGVFVWSNIRGTDPNSYPLTFGLMAGSITAAQKAELVDLINDVQANPALALPADTAAPVLAAITPTPDTTSVSIAWSVDEVSTVHYLVDQNATRTPAQVQAGTSISVTTAGAQTAIDVTGLPEDTQHYVHMIAEDAFANVSAVSTVGFTTGQTVAPASGVIMDGTQWLRQFMDGTHSSWTIEMKGLQTGDTNRFFFEIPNRHSVSIQPGGVIRLRDQNANTVDSTLTLAATEVFSLRAVFNVVPDGDGHVSYVEIDTGSGYTKWASLSDAGSAHSGNFATIGGFRNPAVSPELVYAGPLAGVFVTASGATALNIDPAEASFFNNGVDRDGNTFSTFGTWVDA